MTRKLFTVAIGAAAGIGIASSTAFAATEYSMATSWGGGPVLALSAQAFADQFALLTQNKYKLTVFPGGTMGSPLKVTETVRNRVAEVGHRWNGYDWGIEKTTVLFGGYAGGLNAEEMIHWMYKGGGVELYEEFRREKFDIVEFPCGIAPREMGLHSRKRLQTLADFKGLKLRTAGAWAEIASGMGVSTVILPGAEVYPALERGVVDAIEWAQLGVNKSLGFHKIAKYMIMPGIHQPTAVLGCQFNKNIWDSMSDHDRAMAKIAGKLVSYSYYENMGHDDAYAYNFYIESGNEIVVLDQEVIDKGRELSFKWADEVSAKEGGWFTKILKIQRDYQTAWGNAWKYRDTVPSVPAK